MTQPAAAANVGITAANTTTTPTTKRYTKTTTRTGTVEVAMEQL